MSVSYTHLDVYRRQLAELGASFVKTYYCDDFEKVVAACPVPIVIAGGKKLAVTPVGPAFAATSSSPLARVVRNR